MPRIANYKVGVMRSHEAGPVRWLTLNLAEPEGALSAVSVFFYEKPGAKLGFVNRETGYLVANLPAADFDAMYDLVKTESPVFVTWRLHPDEERLLGIDVSTSEEPVGEGAPDSSP